MSNNGNTPTPPNGWHDELSPVKSSAVAAALEVLGTPPPGWSKAASRARQAEWAIHAASSLNFAQKRDLRRDQLAEAEARLADAVKPMARRELTNYVESCRINLAIAEEIVAAAPAEAQRLRISAERQERKRALSRLQDEVNQAQLRGLAISTETVDALMALADQVAADDLAAEKEIEQRQKLQEESEAAKTKAIEVLTSALDDEIMTQVRLVKKSLTGRSFALIRSYPSMASGEVLQAWKRAQYLVGLISALDGSRIDLMETCARHLDEEQFFTLGTVVRQIAVTDLYRAGRPVQR